MRVPVAVALLAGVALAACGESRQAEVRDTLSRFAKARQSGDTAKVCEQLVVVLDARERALELKRASGRRSEGEQSGGEPAQGDVRPGECEAALRSALAAQKALRSYHQEVQDVRIEGEHAVARVRVDAVRDDGSRLRRTVGYDLLERGGRWRVVLSPE